jgi:hypothetical protein
VRGHGKVTILDTKVTKSVVTYIGRERSFRQNRCRKKSFW